MYADPGPQVLAGAHAVVGAVREAVPVPRGGHNDYEFALRFTSVRWLVYAAFPPVGARVELMSRRPRDSPVDFRTGRCRTASNLCPLPTSGNSRTSHRSPAARVGRYSSANSSGYSRSRSLYVVCVNNSRILTTISITRNHASGSDPSTASVVLSSWSSAAGFAASSTTS